MDNLLQLAMQMILCLLIAALIGALIGYLLGKMSKCDKQEESELPLSPNTKKQNLHDYENHEKEESHQDRGYHLATHTSTPPNSSAATAATRISQVQADNDIIETTHAIKKNFDEIEGERPMSLSSPRDGIPDDLKEISGIGLKIEEALHELGIFHFDQIAKWTPDNIKWIDNYLVFKGRVNREDWVGQAKLLAAGGSTEFSRRMRKNRH